VVLHMMCGGSPSKVSNVHDVRLRLCATHASPHRAVKASLSDAGPRFVEQGVVPQCGDVCGVRQHASCVVQIGHIA
jgi:hypothetical protein